MPTNTSEARIVVGIDATPASRNGVRFAALEAQRLGAELHIVHATPGYSDVPGDIPVMDEGRLRRTGSTSSRRRRQWPAPRSRNWVSVPPRLRRGR